jgi:hypothetical protein
MQPDHIVSSQFVKKALWERGRMTSHSPDYRSEYLRERAKELLEYARTMKDLELRRDVETIAKSYERLASGPARREDTKDDGERQKPDAPKLLVNRQINVASQADVAGE